MRTVGARVGAIFGSDSKTKIVKFLGYGVYEGDFPLKELGGLPNPRIKLDDGSTVWGAECWWGPEDRIKAELAKAESDGYTIVNVNADVLRAQAEAEGTA